MLERPTQRKLSLFTVNICEYKSKLFDVNSDSSQVTSQKGHDLSPTQAKSYN